MSHNIEIWSDNVKLFGWRVGCNVLKLDVENLANEEISDIVFGDIADDGRSADVALVFGNYQLQEERVKKACELYKSGRVKKIMLLGGSGGMSNSGSLRSEAELMKRQTLKLGVRPEDIITDAKSNSTRQNCKNAAQILGKMSYLDTSRLILVSNDFHLNRCKLLCERYFSDGTEFSLVSCKSGFTDIENWYESKMGWKTGRGIVTIEASHLLRMAKKDKINNLVRMKNNKM